MPIQPNFLERTAFFTLNAAPGPMLDLAGALAACAGDCEEWRTAV
jgi:hypothetical protein